MKTITFQRRLPKIRKSTVRNKSGALCVSFFKRGNGLIAQALACRNGERSYRLLTVKSISTGAQIRTKAEALEVLKLWVQAQMRHLEAKHASVQITVRRRAVNRKK